MPDAPTSIPELEVRIDQGREDEYYVQLRYSLAGDQADHFSQRQACSLRTEDFDSRRLQCRAREYGERLTEQVFSDPGVREAYVHWKGKVGDADRRVRLLIDDSAPALHRMRWELLRDPVEPEAGLTTAQRVFFSRLMVSKGWRSVQLRKYDKLEALIAVSAPTNPGEWNLAPVDFEGESERARAALGPIRSRVVGGPGDPLTLERLDQELRKGVDILYLVCHGVLEDGKHPKLYLQNPDETADERPGQELADRIRELETCPRLIVLASCESAKAGEVSNDESAEDDEPEPTASQAALAPRLAEAGVPAVLAMQGKITMESVEKAMPVFFEKLQEDGQIDRALAEARNVIRDRPDAWMPALFSRLKTNRIWYVPGFAGDKGDFKKWPAICDAVRQGKVVPILGPDFGESVFGGTAERASDLAEQHHFPMAEYDRADLAKVAQFLAIDQARDTAQSFVQKHFLGRLKEAAARVLGPDHGIAKPKDLVHALAARLRADETNPYGLIARIPAKLYVNAGHDLLLFEAIDGASLPGNAAPTKSPERVAFRWRSTEDFHPQLQDFREPTIERPIVYQVFGDVREPETLVLTEDDFFDYLIEMHYHRLMPVAVRGQLTRSSLLFLGFKLTDWTFRVLFRMIMNQRGLAGIRDLAHVGVQVNPDDHTFADVERAREYLRSYYGEGIRAGRAEVAVNVYWGSTEDFLSDLREKLTQEAEPVAAATEGDDEW